jgi:peroxiredoxin
MAVAAVGGAATILVIVLGVALSRGVGDSPIGRAEAGFDTAAEFTLPTFDGGDFALADYASRPLFIYFWASWCGPCEREAPLIESLWPEFEERGVTFVGINMWDAESDARRFAERHGITFPLLRDESGTVNVDYGVVGLPEAFFIRPGLLIRQKFTGELTEGDFRALLEDILSDAS